MGKTANVKQAARAKARARRVAMDVERADRDRRVEDATAEALLLLAERAQIEHQRDQTIRAIADALRRLVAEGIGADAVAQLVELEVGEVRRLTRRTSISNAGEVTDPSPVRRSDETAVQQRAG